jgi:threonine/homoserine/homoserine lactone efflux protein
MYSSLFLQAALIGLSIAAPVGPIGLLCIQRTLSQGARIGFASGLGAALADACYGALGAWGIGGLNQALLGLRLPLAWAGCLFLAWLAWQSWRAAPAHQAAQAGTARGWLSAAGSVFLLTLSNPLTILSFLAIFASLNQAGTLAGGAAVLVLGVFCGSAAWWLGLALLLAATRRQLSASWQQRIRQGSGALLLGMAVWQAAKLLAGAPIP